MKFGCVFLLFIALSQGLFANSWRDINDLGKELYELGLSNAQQSQVEQVLHHYYKQLRLFWRKQKNMDLILMDDMKNDKFSYAKNKSMLSSLSDEKLSMDLAFLSRIHAILSKEQRRELSEKFDKFDKIRYGKDSCDDDRHKDASIYKGHDARSCKRHNHRQQ